MKVAAAGKQLFAFLVGLLIAVGMLATSIALAGHGHGGWAWAILPSILGLVGWPLAISAWVSIPGRARYRAMVSLSVAVVADIVVVPGFIIDSAMLLSAPLGGTVWVIFHLGWHGAVIARLVTLRIHAD